jgi:hypothetical protein
MKGSVNTAGVLLIALVLTAGCVQSKRTYIQVVDSRSREPLGSTKIKASLYDPIDPDPNRTHIKQVLTGSNGLAVIRMPMCSTRRVPPTYLYAGGRHIGRANPNATVGPEVILEKKGYASYVLYRSNEAWQCEHTSREEPFVVPLARNSTVQQSATTNYVPRLSDEEYSRKR